MKENDSRQGVRGWIVIALVVIVGLGFYLAGREAVDELTASGQLKTTAPAEEISR